MTTDISSFDNLWATLSDTHGRWDEGAIDDATAQTECAAAVADYLGIEAAAHPCDKCEEPVPVDEHLGNDRPDGTSEYLCPACYVPLPPTPEALADKFRSVMQEWFKDSPETLLLIDKQNLAFLEQGHGDKYCATGDHCDSNQAMCDAWTALTGAEPQLVNYEDEDLPLGCIPPEATADLINKAWSIAKRAGFATTQQEPQP